MQKKIDCFPNVESDKVVFLDWGVFLHKAIFASQKSSVSSIYVALTMIVGDLKKVGISPNDTIILAVDSHGKGNWRKDLDSQYKSTRRKKREDTGIDWETHFCMFENLLNDLDSGTPFHVVEIDRLEADDIISAGCRFYKDKEIVIVSHDSDYEQLFEYKNVKIFNPKSKKYKKPVENPQAVLQSKIKKEVADDLISPILSERDYEIRKTIVSLLSLPDSIENQVIDSLKKISPKQYWDLNKLPFPVIRQRFSTIYNNDKKVDYIDSIIGKKKKRKTKQQSIL